MRTVRFIEAARKEFLTDVTWYNSSQPGLGKRFSKAVEEAVSLVLSFPQAGSLAVSNTRKVVIKNFPYSLYYRAEKNSIIIFAIAHHARKPGYWSVRT